MALLSNPLCIQTSASHALNACSLSRRCANVFRKEPKHNQQRKMNERTKNYKKKSARRWTIFIEFERIPNELSSAFDTEFQISRCIILRGKHQILRYLFGWKNHKMVLFLVWFVLSILPFFFCICFFLGKTLCRCALYIYYSHIVQPFRINEYVWCASNENMFSGCRLKQQKSSNKSNFIAAQLLKLWRNA